MYRFLFHGKHSVAENPTDTNTELNIFIPFILNILKKEILLYFIQLLSSYKIKHGLYHTSIIKYYLPNIFSLNIQFKQGARKEMLKDMHQFQKQYKNHLLQSMHD